MRTQLRNAGQSETLELPTGRHMVTLGIPDGGSFCTDVVLEFSPDRGETWYPFDRGPFVGNGYLYVNGPVKLRADVGVAPPTPILLAWYRVAAK